MSEIPSVFMDSKSAFAEAEGYEAAVEKYNVLAFGVTSIFSSGVTSQATVDGFKEQLGLYRKALSEGGDKPLQAKEELYEFVSGSKFNKVKLIDLMERIDAMTEAFHEVSHIQRGLVKDKLLQVADALRGENF